MVRIPVWHSGEWLEKGEARDPYQLEGHCNCIGRSGASKIGRASSDGWHGMQLQNGKRKDRQNLVVE